MGVDKSSVPLTLVLALQIPRRIDEIHEKNAFLNILIVAPGPQGTR